MSKEENETLEVNEEIEELEEELIEAPQAESEDNAYVMPSQSYKDSIKSSKKHASSAPKKVVASEDEFVMPKESYKESVKNSKKRQKAAKAREREAQLRAEDDETEYIASWNRHRQHHHHHLHHHHHHHSSTSMHSGRTKNNNTPEAEKEAMDGYVFRTPHKKKRRRRKRKRAVRILWIVLAVILGLTIVTGSTFLILRQIGDAQMHDYNDVEIVIPEDSKELASEEVEIMDEGKVITYNGDTYKLNEKVSSIVLIGVDKNIEDEESMMSDAIYILAIDSDTNRVTMISVSRDTMADVDVYSDQGTFIDTEKIQLSYAYSFEGDGKNGAENTTAAVSKLFFGLPFNNYFAMDLDALVTLNDAIGGVTLTPTMTFTSPIDGSTIQAGESTTLFGKEAETYVRSRDMSELESNNDRMARQIQYIQAFLNSAIPAAKANISVVSELYGTIKANSVTSLTVPQMTYLVSSGLSLISDSSQIEYRGIEGEMREGEHAEFYPNDQSVLELMLDVFYSRQ
ncbi:MAG: LCP family protein [Ruminococcus sp.]|nr:LCP family protein [Ruminococcus sp.]